MDRRSFGSEQLRCEEISMKIKLLIIPALVAAILVARASPIFAEMQIIESNVREFVVGQRIPETDDLRLPAGGRVKVIILPATETKIFLGPNLTNKMNSPFGSTRGVDIHNPRP